MRTAAKEKKDAAEAAPAPAPTPAAEPEKAPKKEKPGKSREPKEGKEGKEKKAKTGAPQEKKARRPAPDNPNFRYIVRVANTDLDGLRPAALALTGVPGVGLRIAEVTCRLAGVPPREMLGNIPEATVEGLEGMINELPKRLPPWMLNHPADHATTEIHHYISAELETSRRDDVNLMKMIRSYRGVRHERGQKVRGQRTRSNGRTGMAAGVLKKVAKEAAAAKSKEASAPTAAPAAAPAPAAAEKKKV
ncbi:MAG: 30S ribosomal protein S13 [Thermoplasmata archaeon]|nr:30S ribosomal protein S13 [Thermoplasmata archaeon]